MNMIPASSLFEMEVENLNFVTDITSQACEDPNGGMNLNLHNVLERPHLNENYNLFSKDYQLSSGTLTALGVGSLKDLCDIPTSNNDEYLSVPTQEVDSSEVAGINYHDFFDECVESTGAGQLNSHTTSGILHTQKASGSLKAYKEETLPEKPVKNFIGNTQVEAEFIPLKCEKQKNPPYLLEQGEIYCKPEHPVNIKVKGIEEGQTVSISLQFTAPLLENSPVLACKQHRRGDEDTPISLTQHLPGELLKNEDPSKFSFFSTIKKCDYKLIDDHPTIVIPAQGGDINRDGSMVFNLVFICLNSCHKTKGKQIYLLMKLADNKGNVIKEQRFNIRVCKNVKRDHKEKLAAEDQKDAPMAKKLKLDPEEVGSRSVPHCEPNLNTNEEEKRHFLIYGAPSKLQKCQGLFELLDVKLEPLPLGSQE
ncbi:hypothetical protein Pcinc_011322 [Petrolisthes cinctipes]|uniref:p53 DNA-binding domain-containing protein n=1 Tax=Petrolisthes cinctipes TaxID=88211 RepID=A0AAE1G335_PETCI|nr:hypothetical protein Pcinc_011322 [Petrolisthes cinctipes]